MDLEASEEAFHTPDFFDQLAGATWQLIGSPMEMLLVIVGRDDFGHLVSPG